MLDSLSRGDRITMMYSKVERWHYIEKRLTAEGRVHVASLAEVLGVVPETVRRDLVELEAEGKLHRVHGGAVPKHIVQKELAYVRKLEIEYEAKRAIAKYAATLIRSGDVIAIDTGTTTVHIADFISEIERLTVITNSLPAALRWSDAIEEGRMTGEVILLGGTLHTAQRAVSGMVTLEQLRPMVIDHAFLSCGGVKDNRLYDYEMNESLVSGRFIRQSRHRWILADATKWNHVSFYEVGLLQDVDGLLINAPEPNDWNEYTKWIEIGGE